MITEFKSVIGFLFLTTIVKLQTARGYIGVELVGKRGEKIG